MKFYELHFPDNDESDKYGVAYIAEDDESLRDLVQEEITSYKPLPYFVIRDGIPSGRLATDAGCRLFSKKLIDIILQFASEDDLNNLWLIPTIVEYDNTRLSYSIFKI